MRKRADMVREMKGIWEHADAGGRELTSTERSQVEGLLRRIDSAKVLEELDGDYGANRATASAYKTIGEAFVESDGYKKVRDPARRGETWSSGLIDTGQIALGMKGTLLEGSGSPGSGSGGGLLPVPQVVPGVVDKLFQPLHIEDLLLSGQATGNTVRVAVEGTATSAAAGVAEGGVKPESTLGYSAVDEPVKKIATSLTVSDELLEDAVAIQAFINSRLVLFCRIEAERQLLRGTSGGNEVQGLLTSRGVPVYQGLAADDRATQLFRGMNSMRGSAFLEPDWVIVHPTDWERMRLLRDGLGGTAGAFMGGGPFLGSYGQGPVDSSNQVAGAVDSIWGKPAYVSNMIGAGTALVGTRAGAQVWNRGGVSVEASNSHASYFVTDLVALRAERRLALTCYRSQGYVECRLVAGPGG
jgi:HK97 family phage major capsid protein